MKPSVLFVSRSCHERAIPARAFSRNVRETQEGESVGLLLLPATTRRVLSLPLACVTYLILQMTALTDDEDKRLKHIR